MSRSAPAIACTILAACALAAPVAAVEAFPDAEGFGRFAQGGRGGAIIHVTNLNDSGPGSLRACIDATGPRTCIFRVGGVIRFTTRPPIIRNPYLTIAGQTAPGGGILLTHAGGKDGFTPLLIKGTHDIVVRHVRVRPDQRGESEGGNDAFTIENSANVILDHVSGSWALDENVNGHGDNDNLTISWSIFAEGIPQHDKCALLSSDPKGPQRLSFTKNICAHNGDRNPDANFPPGSCVEVVSNIFYNAQWQFAEIWESNGGSPINIVDNYFRAGPSTMAGSAAIDRELVGSTGQARIYAADNYVDGDMPLFSARAKVAEVPSPVCPLPGHRLGATDAYHEVLASAGAFPRDAFDQRIVHEVRTRTGALVAGPGILPVIASGSAYPDNDRDGMSDVWEGERGLDTARNDAWEDLDRDGWTNLDEFLDYAHGQVISGVPIPITPTPTAGNAVNWLLVASVAGLGLGGTIFAARLPSMTLP